VLSSESSVKMTWHISGRFRGRDYYYV